MDKKDAYKKLHSVLKPGDIIFVSPKSLFFRLIEYWTRDKWGHVAVVMDNKIKVLLIEALPKGIEVTNIERHIDSNRDLKVYRFKNISEEKLNKFVIKLTTFIGKGYDFKSLLNFIIGKAKYRSKKKLFCSELIYRSLVGANIIKHSEKADMVSPHDLRLLIENLSRVVIELNYKNKSYNNFYF